MFGHVHSDIFKQVGSMEDSTDPIGVIQVCGSITTWIGNNPAYCVYELDKETMLPVARRTYYFDLDKANETGTPEWVLLTDWTKDFGMDDLSPSSFKALSEKIGSNEDFTMDYLGRAWRRPNTYTSCNADCRK